MEVRPQIRIKPEEKVHSDFLQINDVSARSMALLLLRAIFKMRDELYGEDELRCMTAHLFGDAKRRLEAKIEAGESDWTLTEVNVLQNLLVQAREIIDDMMAAGYDLSEFAFMQSASEINRVDALRIDLIDCSNLDDVKSNPALIETIKKLIPKILELRALQMDRLLLQTHVLDAHNQVNATFGLGSNREG